MEPVAQASSDEGNTRPHPQRRATRVTPSRYWCVTVFDKTPLSIVKELAHGAQYVIGNEVCPSTGRKHLQCFIIFKKKCRPLETYREWKAHWERMKGTPKQAYEYCKKEGDFIEFGMDHLNGGIMNNDEIVEYLTENNIKIKDINKTIYDLMYVKKRIKTINNQQRQKEFCDNIRNLYKPQKTFDWDISEEEPFNLDSLKL